MENESKIQKCVDAAKSVAKTPGGAFAIFIFLYFFGAAVDKYILDGSPMNEVLSWLWETALTAPQKPLVQIGLLIFAVWSFWRGVKTVIRENRKALEKETETREAAIREVGQLFGEFKGHIDPQLNIVNEVSIIASHLGHYSRCRISMDRAKGQIAEFQSMKKTLSTFVEGYRSEDLHISILPATNSQEILSQLAQSLPESETILELKPMNWVSKSKDGYGYYDANENVAFIKAMDDNIQILNANATSLERYLDKKETELNKRQQTLWASFQKAR